MYAVKTLRRQSIGPGLLVLCLVFLSSSAWAATEITNVRHWAAPDHTRLVFDLSAEPDYTYEVDDKRVVLVFSDAVFSSSVSASRKISRPGLRGVLFTTLENRSCKIEIQLADHLTVEVFRLKKFMDKPDRVVVDIIVAMPEKEEPAKDKAEPSGRKRVIVVDPGHGGEDPGAIGKNGTYEKHVVLAISREIKKAIDKMPGYRAVLTRDGDYYVSFSKRLDAARKTNASLFISVHADAARNRQAKCSSVYCLSTGAASNEAAKLLANNENLSDIIGGVPNGEGNNQSDEIILNMFQTHTLNLSKTFASELIGRLGSVHCLKYPVFHEAPFRVLKLPDTPAVLLETAFISHPEEERLLKTARFRKTVAAAVARSVAGYFGESPALAAKADAGGDSVAAPKGPDAAGPVRTATYRVQRGESLSSIARKHQTELAVLLKLNRMGLHDSLRAGQKILIPAAAPDAAASKPCKKYTVRKGDTLFSLAKSHATSVDELRRLNHMSESDVLCFGQTIRVPQ